MQLCLNSLPDLTFNVRDLLPVVNDLLVVGFNELVELLDLSLVDLVLPLLLTSCT